MINWLHFKQRLNFEFKRIKRLGFLAILKKTLLKVSSIFIYFLFLPITLLLHLAGFRRVTIFTDRIGHLALEPDCLLKEQTLGQIKKRKWIMLAHPSRVANKYLLSYWEPYFIIVRHPLLCHLVISMSKWLLMRYDVSRYILAIDKAQDAYRIYSEWGDRSPILKLSPEDEVWAHNKLKELGLPKNSWFVCVHAREGGFSPVDEELHSHRNSNIENTIPAMREIIRRGGWVIRIGDPSMKPLTPIPQVIDYAHHSLKSEKLDLILCAKARFILGNTSGISLVGTIFGTPCAIANSIPVSTLWLQKKDLCIPKLIWSKNKARYLRLDEIFVSEIANFHYASLYKHNDLEIIENSAEDILLLTQEMITSLNNNTDVETKLSEYQNYVASLFKPNHYSFGSAASISTAFLKRHPELISNI